MVGMRRQQRKPIKTRTRSATQPPRCSGAAVVIVLLADFQVLNQLQVGIGILAVQVFQEPAPMTNELEQAAA